jgi:hypothetical protein
MGNYLNHLLVASIRINMRPSNGLEKCSLALAIFIVCSPASSTIIHGRPSAYSSCPLGLSNDNIVNHGTSHESLTVLTYQIIVSSPRILLTFSTQLSYDRISALPPLLLLIFISIHELFDILQQAIECANFLLPWKDTMQLIIQ